MPALSACLDECTDLHLVRALEARGFNVTSLQLVGPLGIDDGAVLERGFRLPGYREEDVREAFGRG